MRLPDRLPVLRGWPWRIFLSIWTLVLAASLAGTVAAFVFLQPWKSFTVARVNSGLLYAPFSPPMPPTILLTTGREAAQAGIRPGDRLVSIDGRTTRHITPRELDGALAGPDRSRFTVTTMSSDGTRRTVRLTRDHTRFAEEMAAAGLTPGLFVVLNVVLNYGVGLLLPLLTGTILLVRRPRDPLVPWVSLGTIVLPLGNGPSFIWLLSLGGWFAIAAKAAAAAVSMLAILTLALFPDGRFTARTSLIALPVLITGLMMVSPQTDAVLSNAVLLGSLVFAVAIATQRYHTLPPGAGRQQIRWALLGFGFSCAALALFILAQTVTRHPATFGFLVWGWIAQWLLGALLLLLMYGGMTISLMRYRLYDADAAISRSVALGLLTLSLLVIFAGSEKLIGNFAEDYLGKSMGTVASGVGAAIAVALIAPLNTRISRWAERRFQSALVHLRNGLPVLVGDLRENTTPDALCDAVLARIERGVRASHGAVVDGARVIGSRDIPGPAVAEWLAGWQRRAQTKRPLDTDAADRLFPMRVPLRADGVDEGYWLLLGPRPDGSFYGKDERDALIAIASPISRALSVATQRTARERDARHEVSRLSAMIADLESRLSGIETHRSSPAG